MNLGKLSYQKLSIGEIMSFYWLLNSKHCKDFCADLSFCRLNSLKWLVMSETIFFIKYQSKVGMKLQKLRIVGTIYNVFTKPMGFIVRLSTYYIKVLHII